MKKTIVFLLTALAGLAAAQTYKTPIRFYKARIDTPWIGTHDRKLFFDRIGNNNKITSTALGDSALKWANLDQTIRPLALADTFAVILENQTASVDSDSVHIDISGVLPTTPDAVIVINKGPWPAYLLRISGTTITMGISNIGCGNCLFDLLLKRY